MQLLPNPRLCSHASGLGVGVVIGQYYGFWKWKGVTTSSLNGSLLGEIIAIHTLIHSLVSLGVENVEVEIDCNNTKDLSKLENGSFIKGREIKEKWEDLQKTLSQHRIRIMWKDRGRTNNIASMVSNLLPSQLTQLPTYSTVRIPSELVIYNPGTPLSSHKLKQKKIKAAEKYESLVLEELQSENKKGVKMEHESNDNRKKVSSFHHSFKNHNLMKYSKAKPKRSDVKKEEDGEVEIKKEEAEDVKPRIKTEKEGDEEGTKSISEGKENTNRIKVEEE